MHSEPFRERLDELKLLRHGWLDGQGLAPTHAALDWLAAMLGSYFSDDMPLPYLYPTIEGGVRAEWSVPPYELSLHIDLEHRVGAWHSLNMDTDKEQSKKLDLSDSTAWDWLSRELRQLAGAKV